MNTSTASTLPSKTSTPQPIEVPTSTSQPTQGPKTPAQYLATSVARDEWEFPISEAVRYKQPYRPQFHFSPANGWLGDPDGMIRFNDLYHVFWWGHAESKDLVHWNERIQPMMGDDDSFIYYSGSMVVDVKNTSGFGVADSQPPMIAIYTMHHKGSNLEDQGLSISYDYKTWLYYDQNPVLTSDRPAFRDPQVFWDERAGHWLMIITLPEDRKVSFYASKDLKQWEHLSDFGQIGAQAQVWEVPDIFQLSVDGDPNNKKWVLLCGMGPNREQYFIGDFDGKTFSLDPNLNGFLLRGDGLDGERFANFENGLPAGWTVEGDPITIGSSTQLGSHRLSGFLGSGYLSTYSPNSESGDRGKTRVTSPVFSIEKKFINFLVSGGNYNSRAAVSLMIEGSAVRSATGDGTGIFKWVSWDVSDLSGKQAQIQILDDVTGSDFGHVNIDHILFSSTPALSGQEQANWLDFGPDYYAVRTYRDYDHVENRVVTMGWLGNWEYADAVPTAWGKGTLALPREISLQTYAGGMRIVQKPIPALESIREAPVQVGPRLINGAASLAEFKPTRNTYEIDLTFEITDPAAKVGIRVAGNGVYGNSISVGYDASSSSLFLDRTKAENASFSARFLKYMIAPLEVQDGKVRLHIYVDQSMIEVFANDGEVTMSALMFPNADSLGIELFAENGSANLVGMTAWELQSIWGVSAR